MVTHQQMLPCGTCGRATMHLVNKPSHVLHLLLSVFTLGFWIPVWILLAVFAPAPECSQCGTRRGLFGRKVIG